MSVAYNALIFFHHALWPGRPHTWMIIAVDLVVVVMSIACVIGLLLLVRPSRALLIRERGEQLLRMIPWQPADVFRAILKIEHVSFAMPPVIFLSLDLALSAVRYTSLFAGRHYFGLLGEMSGSWAEPLLALPLLYLSRAAIHASFRFVETWAVLLGVTGAIVGGLCFVLLAAILTMAISEFIGPLSFFVFVFLVCVVLTNTVTELAMNIIKYRVLPQSR